MSAFEKFAVERVIAKAKAAGVDIPPEVETMCFASAGSVGAKLWVEQHPGEDDPSPGCCWGSALDGPVACTCWTPVFDVDQAEPRPPANPGDVQAQRRMCGDCAFRKGSPERADDFSEDALFALAESGQPFWCHQDMRRPSYWVHPDGRRVNGSPDDWQPPMVNGIPYRADGRPGLLCAGWAARSARTADKSGGSS